MSAMKVCGIGAVVMVVVCIAVVLVQKYLAQRQEAKSVRIKDRLRRKTKPVPITGPRAATPRSTEE